MTNFYIGTAGWSYKDWEGIVYPLKKESNFHALVFLSRFLNFVEINSTFYRHPIFKFALSWVKRVEHLQDFLFAVKLNQVFTHTKGNFSQIDVDRFKSGIEPLITNNRLAAILLQFPWSFACTSANLKYLINLFKIFSDYPLALEIRQGKWDHPDFFKTISDYKVAFCNIDQPVFKNSIKPSTHTTNPEFSYVRLHGRNYQNWFKKDAGRDARYDYLYSNDELDSWVERIKELGKKSKNVYIVTNNHYRGQAMANALQIKNKISGEKLDIPSGLLQNYPVLKNIIKRIEKGQKNLFDDE